jgi:hypothetical protein
VEAGNSVALHRPRLAFDAAVKRSGFHLPPLFTLAHWTRSDNAQANLTAFMATTKEPVITLTTSFLVSAPRFGLAGLTGFRGGEGAKP